VVGDKALVFVSILLYVDIIGVNSYVTFIDNNSITDIHKRRHFLKSLSLSLVEPFMRITCNKKMHKSIRYLIAKCFNIKEESLNKKAKIWPKNLVDVMSAEQKRKENNFFS
jgi:hypothetical protein